MSLASRVTLLSQRVAAEIKTVRTEMANIVGAYVSTSAPASPKVGQIWHDTDDTTAPIVGVPVGGIIPFGGSSAPSGWLLCQGQSLSRSVYANLFAEIGTTYGSTGSATFSLPDLQDRVPLGKGAARALGLTGGQETITLGSEHLPPHKHTLTTWGHGATAGGTAFMRHTASGASFTYNIDTDNGPGQQNPIDIMPKFVVINYLIKI